MATQVLILGAADPEMEAIERIGKEHGCVIAYATAGGKRVTPATAYLAYGIQALDGQAGLKGLISQGDRVVTVECRFVPEMRQQLKEQVWLVGGYQAAIDHHAPGDAGFGRGPEEYFSASSLGQLILLLANAGRFDGHWDGVEAHMFKRDDRPHFKGATLWWAVNGLIAWKEFPREALIAAADHCPAAAYAGKCPGIDPAELMRFRAETRAAFQRRPVEAVLVDVATATVKLLAATEIVPGVHDMRGPVVPELPEAALRAGVAYVATLPEKDGKTKVVIAGHTTPEIVKAFMAGDIVAGLTHTYGDPVRGFAGGYL